jgi:hypothetical protein
MPTLEPTLENNEHRMPTLEPTLEQQQTQNAYIRTDFRTTTNTECLH